MATATIESTALARLLQIRKRFWDGYKLKINLVDKKDYDFLKERRYIEDWWYFMLTTFISLVECTTHKDYNLIFDRPEFDGEFYSLEPWKEYRHYWESNL